MNRTQTHLAIGAIICLIVTLMLMPPFARAKDDPAQKVKSSMTLLQSEAAKLGAAKVEGTDHVAGLEVPALYFGSQDEQQLRVGRRRGCKDGWHRDRLCEARRGFRPCGDEREEG